jgi:hypothetical protein
MTFRKTFVATATAALLGATAAGAQMFGDEIGTDYDYDAFNTGMTGTGYYNALDRDQDTMLNQSEYATGLYRNIDSNRDLQITEDEFTAGNERYLGDGYTGGAFTDYDVDASGYIDQSEFRTYYDSGYNDDFVSFDGDGDGMLTSDEYNTGLYGRADANQDQIITIEEEGLFEGWFDGDDIEAEIESVGEVY